MINEGIKTIIIVALDSENGIGKDNDLPWNISLDKKFFRQKTIENYGTGEINVCVMGRKTWESIPEYYRGLDKRITFVLSHEMSEETLNEQNATKSEVYLIRSIAGIFEKVRFLKEEVVNGEKRKIGSVFICGGANIYTTIIRKAFKIRINEFYTTIIRKNYNCDVFFPLSLMQDNCTLISNNSVTFKVKDSFSDEIIPLTFCSYSNEEMLNLYTINTEELVYLGILRDLIHEGREKKGRNGITYSKFVRSMTFNLFESFPLYTTKKINIKTVAEELLFFLSGKTNTKLLEEKGVNIWKKNTSADFLKQMNLPWKEGDMGPMYGFNWRYFGAEYKGCDEDYEGQGFDQIKYCLNLLKNDPYSRRIIMTSLNVANVSQGVLFPCHGIHIQFDVEEKECERKIIRLLSCSVTIRSNDWCVGHPFNVASYALFVHFFCYALNNDKAYDGPRFKPFKLHLIINDVHLYDNHMENAMIQLTRLPFKFPTLKIKEKEEGSTNVFPSYDDLILENYKHCGFLRYEMNA